MRLSWVLILYQAKNDKMSFFKFLLKMFSALFGFGTRFFKITTHKVIQSCARPFCQAGKLMQKFDQQPFFSFLGQYNVKQSPVEKFERGKGFTNLIDKILYPFNLGNSFGWYVFELFKYETNLRKKHSVAEGALQLMLSCRITYHNVAFSRNFFRWHFFS